MICNKMAPNKNLNEVVRVELRSLEKETRIIALRNAIQEGIESGIAHDFNPDLHLRELKSEINL